MKHGIIWKLILTRATCLISALAWVVAWWPLAASSGSFVIDQVPVSYLDVGNVPTEAAIDAPAAESSGNIAEGIAAKVRQQQSRCWTLPAGLVNTTLMPVTLYVEYSPSGEVIRADPTPDTVANSVKSAKYQALINSAIYAIRKCSPLTGLSQEHYKLWHFMEVHFDPHPNIQ